jgi:hypothetical protein
MSDEIERFWQDFGRRSLPLFNLAAGVEKELVKQALDVPIQYQRGQTIRSRPGEPPRRGKSDPRLQKSVKHRAYLLPDRVGASVGAGPVFGKEGEYSAKLERGNWFSNLYKRIIHARPYLRPSRSRFITNRFSEILRNLAR